MKAEGIFQRRVIKDLKTLGKIWILKTQEKTRKGIPDILMCLNGRFIALELKASKKAIVAPLQCYEIAQIQHSVGLAFIAYPENWNEVFEEIKRIVD